MSKYVGDFLVGKSVRLPFNTVNTAGVPTTLTTGAVIVTKDGADASPSGGVSLLTDVGGVTGRHQVVVDLSVDLTTFTAGSDYTVRLSGSSAVAGTSVVGSIVGHFSIQNRSTTVDTTGRVVLQPAQIAAITSGVFNTQLAESYNADGVAPTLAQGIYFVMQRLADFNMTGTLINVHKLDGTTTAYQLTLTLDASNNPIATTRSS
jgi:hypothetical protein